VPIVAACRSDVAMDSNTLRRVPDKHGNLPRNTAALDEVEGILTASSIIIKAARPIALRVDLPEFALAGKDVTVQVTPSEPTRYAIHLSVRSETGTLVEARMLRPSSRTTTTSIDASPQAHTPSTSPDQRRCHHSRPSAATSSSGKTGFTTSLISCRPGPDPAHGQALSALVG
jgi:hypothetical protein